jgi:hypothetical protein
MNDAGEWRTARRLCAGTDFFFRRDGHTYQVFDRKTYVTRVSDDDISFLATLTKTMPLREAIRLVHKRTESDTDDM